MLCPPMVYCVARWIVQYTIDPREICQLASGNHRGWLENPRTEGRF